MSKPNILNLCTVVRNAMIEAKFSSVKIVAAVNGYLASENNKLAGTTEKSGGFKITGRKELLLKSSVTTKESFEAGITPEALMVDFNTRMAEVEAIHGTSWKVQFGTVLTQWMEKFAQVEAEPAKSK